MADDRADLALGRVGRHGERNITAARGGRHGCVATAIVRRHVRRSVLVKGRPGANAIRRKYA